MVQLVVAVIGPVVTAAGTWLLETAGHTSPPPGKLLGKTGDGTVIDG